MKTDGNQGSESPCREILDLYSQRIESLEGSNVFVSKRMEECSMEPWLEDEVQFVDNYGHLILPPGYVQLLPSGAEL